MIRAEIDKIAFPSISEEQFEIAKKLGEQVDFELDEVLIMQGQKDYPFFLIESGEVRIAEKCGDHERLIATHGPGGITGDDDMLTGRSAVISAIANGHVEAIRMCHVRLRRLLNELPAVSEILLEAA